MRQLLLLAEKVFTVISLLFYTGGPLVVILSGGASEGPEEGSALTPDFALVKIIFQINYIITFLLLSQRWEKPLYLLVKDRLILVMMVIILFSAGWSSAPAITLNRAIAFTGTSFFGIYFATYYTPRQQLTMLGWAYGTILLLSFGFVLALPQYGIMGGFHLGSWRGIYTHKNVLGAMMAISSITFLLLAKTARTMRWLFWCGLGCSVLLLLMSRSSSPLMYLTVLVICFFVLPQIQGQPPLKMLALSISLPLLLGGAIAAALQPEAIVGIVGKDLTLTGRTDLWEHAWELILQRPWLGYGYNALWSDWESESASVWRAVGWQAPSSHNGFIELWLALGLLGMVIFAVHFLTSLSRALVAANRHKSPEYYMPVLVLIFTILSNITEAPLLDRNNIYWVLYVASTLSLCHQVTPEQVRAARSPD
jgi:exopolysaccharide production protein ExoQ